MPGEMERKGKIVPPPGTPLAPVEEPEQGPPHRDPERKGPMKEPPSGPIPVRRDPPPHREPGEPEHPIKDPPPPGRSPGRKAIFA